jgi:hypothetical protein
MIGFVYVYVKLRSLVRYMAYLQIVLKSRKRERAEWKGKVWFKRAKKLFWKADPTQICGRLYFLQVKIGIKE